MTRDQANTLPLGQKVEFEGHEYEVAAPCRESAIGRAELVLWNGYSGYLVAHPTQIDTVTS